MEYFAFSAELPDLDTVLSFFSRYNILTIAFQILICLEFILTAWIILAVIYSENKYSTAHPLSCCHPEPLVHRLAFSIYQVSQPEVFLNTGKSILATEPLLSSPSVLQKGEEISRCFVARRNDRLSNRRILVDSFSNPDFAIFIPSLIHYHVFNPTAHRVSCWYCYSSINPLIILDLSPQIPFFRKQIELIYCQP
jgi:hypothetical protein